METRNGWIVSSAAGHDRDTVYCVIGQEEKTGRLLLADGRRRRISAPKAKKPGHVRVLDRGGFDHPAVGKLRQGLPVSDRELRRALAAFKEGITLGKR